MLPPKRMGGGRGIRSLTSVDVTRLAGEVVVYTPSVDPSRLQERDVFLQITLVPLGRNILTGDYELSIGVYQDSSDGRLPVFDNNGQVRGDRIFLYPIEVIAAQ